jgi:hypothetical protein
MNTEIAQAATRIAEVAGDMGEYPLRSHPAQFEHEDF